MTTIYSCPRDGIELDDYDGQDFWCPVEQEAIPLPEVMADGGEL